MCKNMDRLFADELTFTKVRPTGMSNLQRNELYLSYAEELIANGWLCAWNDDGEYCSQYIVDLLEKISFYQDGIEIAKDIAKDIECLINRRDCEVVSFVECDDEEYLDWLDDRKMDIDNIIYGNIAKWVSIFDIKPKITIGTKLISTKDFPLTYIKKGDCFDIKHINNKLGLYELSHTAVKTRSSALAFEVVEEYFMEII